MEIKVIAGMIVTMSLHWISRQALNPLGPVFLWEETQRQTTGNHQVPLGTVACSDAPVSRTWPRSAGSTESCEKALYYRPFTGNMAHRQFDCLNTAPAFQEMWSQGHPEAKDGGRETHLWIGLVEKPHCSRMWAQKEAWLCLWMERIAEGAFWTLKSSPLGLAW